MGLKRNLRRIFWNAKLSINGTRHQALKDHITQSLSDIDLGFKLNHSDARLSLPVDERARLAVISCMPPAETGISTCTLLTFREAGYPVDIFSHYASNEDYMIGSNDQRLRGTNAEVFDVSALPSALRKRNYAACLFAVGNSDHNIPLMRFVRRFRPFFMDMPFHVHVHDPVLLHLCQKVMEGEGRNLVEVFAAKYGKQTSMSAEHLLEAGRVGVRPLFDELNISSFIVNSDAARKMVAADTVGTTVHTFFHPVPPMNVTPIVRGNNLRIGTFGVPNGSKQTELIVQAFERLRERIPDAILVIAGFDAQDYALQNGLTQDRGFEVHDNPSDWMFDRLLGSVDLAVQLRSRNLGESSGVVPRLISLGKSVIATQVGAFADYGNAIRGVSPSITAGELYAVMSDEISADGRQHARNEYMKNRSPHDFCSRIGELVGIN